MALRFFSMRISLFTAAAFVSAAVFAGPVVIQSLPVSPYADTEVSTNIPVNKADIGYSDLHFAFVGTPTNNLEFAFGTDVNTNGVLDVEEMETRFGWRSGRYFIENARTWESLHSGTVPETQSLSVDMHIFVQWTPQIASRVEVSGVNASSFCDIATNAPPAWLWRREWNLMRVTRRGTEQPSDWVSCDEAAYGFIIRVQ